MDGSEVDVLVIGAGIQGTGVAQAAAAAGHSVLLIEESAPASGTSSKSSKLIHGGLRYLESFQFGLVRESLKERAILLGIAPHLVQLVPFSIPIYKDTSRHRWQIRAGLSLYSILGGLGRDTRYRSVPRRDWEKLDGLRTDGLRGVYRYHDGQTDDARLVRAVLRSSKDLGAQVEMPATLESAERKGDGWIVRFRNTDGGSESRVTARVVVNAAGPWANRVLERFAPHPPSRGIALVGGAHIELEGSVEEGIYYTEAPSDRRAVFVIPWKGHTMVGTTERDYTGDPRELTATEEETQYLEATYDHYFPGKRGKRISSWAGLRVLPEGDGRAFDRPREVILVADNDARPSVVTIYGGKLTGYRHTAERVLAEIQRTLGAHGQDGRKADTATLKLPNVE